jgi:hypothetical protein
MYRLLLVTQEPILAKGLRLLIGAGSLFTNCLDDAFSETQLPLLGSSRILEDPRSMKKGARRAGVLAPIMTSYQ